jgi:glyoxylase-like metal-dependent hydrolase (beta-lactamase superfamily II)
MTRTKLVSLAVLSSALVVSAAVAQMGDASKVDLKSSPVAGTVTMIEGATGFAGGNVGVFAGDDGVLVVDDFLTGLGPKLKAKVATISPKPIKFLLNTHWHGDHAGGNAFFGGTGPVLVAHDNVRKRLSTEQTMEWGGHKMTVPPLPAAAQPVVTFAEEATIHFNGDDVHIIHMPPAHTDGDVIVHFTKANVLHTGDVFVNQSYPVIDFPHGGRMQGLIDSATKIIALCDDNTKIIPGHGPLATKADVVAWKKMLEQMRDKVAKLVKAKKSLEQVKAAKPLGEWARLDNAMIKNDMVVEMIYGSLTAK